jgi:hypothetical protein
MDCQQEVNRFNSVLTLRSQALESGVGTCRRIRAQSADDPLDLCSSGLDGLRERTNVVLDTLEFTRGLLQCALEG